MRSQTATARTEERLRQRAYPLLGLVFLGALVLRCLYVWGQARNNPVFDHPIMDARQHHEWAMQIASGDGMGPGPYFRAPLYYYLLGALYRVFGPNVALARFAGALIGAATCYLVALLGATLAGSRAGVLAGIVAAIYWPFIYFDAELLTVGLEVLLDVALLLLLLRAGERCSPWLFLAAGVVGGLSAITRPSILAFAPAILVWLWITAPAARRAARTLRTAAWICLGAAAMILPVTVRNYVVGGEFVLIATNGGVNFYIGNNPASNGASAVVPGTRKNWLGALLDTRRIAERELGGKPCESEVSDYWYRKAFAWIRSDPLAWAKLTLRKLQFFWSPVEIPNNQPIRPYARQAEIAVLFWIGFPIVTCLAGAGVVFLRDAWRRWLLPLVFLVVHMATVVAFFCNARYRLAVAPVLIVIAAAGIVRFARAVRCRDLKSIAGYVGLGAACAVLLASLPPDRQRSRIGAEAQWHVTLGTHYGTPTPKGPGEWAKSVDHFRKAVQLVPRHSEARLGLGRGLLRLDRSWEAERQFALAVRQRPNDARARWHYGLALASVEKYEQALVQYRTAINLQPTYAEAHQELGCLLARLGRETAALHHLRTALAIEPDLIKAGGCWQTLLKRNPSATNSPGANPR